LKVEAEGVQGASIQIVRFAADQGMEKV